MQRTAPVVLLFLPALAASCSLAIGSFVECKADADCDDRGKTLVCTDRLCVLPARAADAGLPDDAGAADGGLSDAGPADAGAPDGGPPDPLEQKCQRTLGAEGKDVITLGVLLPYTTGAGAEDPRGKAREQSIQLAVEEINQREGVNGKRKLRMILCDTSGDASSARGEAALLIRKYATPALISSGSQETLSISAESISAGVLLVSGSATSPELTTLPDKLKPGDKVGLVWRVAPSDAIQGKVLGDLVKEALKASGAGGKVATIAVDDPYGQGLAQVFEARIAAAASAKQTFFFARGSDPTTAVTQAEAFKPAITLVIGVPGDAGKVLAAVPGKFPMLAASKFFFSDSAKSASLFKSLSDKAFLENCRGTAPATLSGAAFDSFRSRYTSKFGSDPNLNSFTAHNYDATYLLALSASWAATGGGDQPITGYRMAEGLSHVSKGTARSIQPTDYTAARADLETGNDIDVVGASGPLDFDSVTGEAPSSIEEWKYTDAKGIESVKVHPPPM